MVTFPAVIESGSHVTFCASLLKPKETLQMNVYLVDGNHSKTLFQETVEKDLHHCFNFEVYLYMLLTQVCKQLTITLVCAF